MRERERTDGLKPQQVLQYLELPLRRPFHVLVPLALITAAAVGASYLVPRRYQSSTLVMVEAERIPDSFVAKSVEKPKRLETVRQEVLSRTRLERILQELDPYPGSAGSEALTVRVERMRDATNVTVKGDDAFTIAYTHRDPRKAMEVTARLASLFIEETTLTSERDVTEATRFIESQLTEARAQLETSEEKLRRFKESHMGSLPEQLPANLAALQRLQLEQQSLGADLQAALARVGTLEGAASTARTPARETSAELVQLRNELAALRTRYTEEHPDVLALRSRIARLEKAAQETAPGAASAGSAAPSAALQQARAEVRTLRGRETDVSQRAAVFQARVEQTPRIEQELLALTRDYDKLKENYLALLNKKMAAGMTEKMEREWKGERFRVLDPAHLPDRPVYPRRIRFLGLGLLAGLVVGLGLCFGLEQLDHSLKTPGEAERLLPHPLLVTIPHVGRRLRLRRGATAPASGEWAYEVWRPAVPEGRVPELTDADLAEAFEGQPGETDLAGRAAAAYPADEPLADLLAEPETPAAEETPPEPPPPTVVRAPAPPARESLRVEPPPPEPKAPRAEPRVSILAEQELLPLVPLTDPEPPPLVFVDEPPPPPARARPEGAGEPTIPIEIRSPPPRREAPPAPGTAPLLVVMGTEAPGQSLALGRPESWLGSGADCDLRIEREHVAPRHARVFARGGGMAIEDNATIHGTYVNGRRLVTESPLFDGDQVYLGPPGSRRSARLLFQARPEAAGITAPAPWARPPALPPRPAPPTFSGRPAPSPSAVKARPATPRAPARGAARPRRTPVRKSTVALAVPPRVLLWAAAAAIGLGAGAWGVSRLLGAAAPKVWSADPVRVQPGETLTLLGSGFAAEPAANHVRLGDREVPVDQASQTRLTLTVPEDVGRPGMPVSVVVESSGRSSVPFPLAISAPPTILSFEPPASLPGQEVRAVGRHLDREDIAVQMGGMAATVLERGEGALRLRVPAELIASEGQRLPVSVEAGGEAGRASELVLGHLPIVLEVRPPSGRAGERVTLRGFGFAPAPGATTVTFGGRPALVLSATATELVVAAPPAGALSGEVPVDVAVAAGGSTSAGSPTFTVVRPSADIFRPRFYPAPVPEHPGHDHVLVATELGPVLLLSGGADGVGATERAARAATALNELMDAAAKPMALEVRERPLPGVGLAGGESMVLTATPRDVAGYGEEWEPGVTPARTTPRSLANFWTALLQDHLTLFALRSRPTRVLEVSPRGRVLTDLYGAAVRRAGVKAGVPASLVNPLPTTLAKGIRDLALLVPPEGQPAVGAAVVGRWEGTMEERDAGARPLKLRLFLTGQRLGGTVTMGAGRLTLEAPLQNVDYARGSLRFVLPVGTAPLYFQGTVRDETLDGLIQAAPPAREARGFFSLRYLE